MIETLNFGVVSAFAIYLLGILAIGIFYMKHTNNISDYILGGRSLNSWVASLSAQASDMSGWLLMGLPGAAYLSGLDASWIAIGLGLGTYLNWKFVASRLRQYTQVAGNSLTLSDYFENRFEDHSKRLRVISAAFIIIFFVFYTASGFVAGGKLFSTVFGIEYTTALTIGAICIVAYTFMGGFMAVSVTDFFQGMLMFFAVIIVPIVAVFELGGFGATVDQINAINPEFLNIFTHADGTNLTALAIISSLAWGLGYFGQPHILARFMAIRSTKEVKQARLIAMVWVTLSLMAAVAIGIVGRVFLQPELTGTDVETVFMHLVNSIFPTFLAGFFLAAILSAVMSTADSQLLVSASAITEDVYRAFIKKNATDKELVWVGRLTVVLVACISFFFAWNPESSVLDLVAYAWAGFGASFGPTILFSLFWKDMTRNGALWGIISGGLTVIVWEQLVSLGGIFTLYSIVPGFIVSILCIVLFSKLDKRRPSSQMVAHFNEVNNSKQY